MKRLIGRSALLSAAILATQLTMSSCSSESPVAPATESMTGQYEDINRVQVQIVPNTTANTAVVNDRYVREEAPPALEIQFTALIAGLDAQASTIRLMSMETFVTKVGHVDENTILLDAQGNPVTLADFGLCSTAEVRADEINETELHVNFLKMKPF